MSRTRVAVLRGGPSDEYDVSLKTGASVLGAMDKERFEPVDVVITKNGEWLVGGYVKNPEQILRMVDVAFVGLHGTYGEDGTVQKLLEKYSVPYTGSRSFPSAIAMNKDATKSRLRAHNILMAPHMTVSSASQQNLYTIATNINNLFGPKYIVKPIAGGSSVGVIKVDNPGELAGTLEKLLQNFDRVIVEQYIEGKEATCGVIENFRNETLYTLPPIEIIPPRKSPFFDYESKYNNKTEEICPGRFSTETKREIAEIAKKVHEILELSQYSRSDFIVSGNGIYFLEVNTLPGLTPESLFPRALDSVGASYGDFISHLLTDRLTSG